MSVVIEQTAEGSMLRLNGDVSISAARELKGALVETLASGRELTIDLAGLTALDITALQLLWAAQHAAAKAGSQVTLVGPVVEEVKQAMDLVSMERALVEPR
jgi:anti-sigma B factor antagonist